MFGSEWLRGEVAPRPLPTTFPAASGHGRRVERPRSHSPGVRWYGGCFRCDACTPEQFGAFAPARRLFFECCAPRAP